MTSQVSEEIKVQLPDQSFKALERGATGYTLAKAISNSLANAAVAITINGEIKDINTYLQDGDNVEILTKQDERSLEVLRHSTAHVMAQAVQKLFPSAKIGIGPNIQNGFYYDFEIPDHKLTPDDFPAIEQEMKNIAKAEQMFKRINVEDVEKQLCDFKDKGEKYKAELLDQYKEESPTLYLNTDKGGNILWNDFCRGPHITNTKYIKHFKLLSVAGAYWRGNEKNAMLQRIYATAFWNSEDLETYIQNLEEAEKRDHRKLSNELDLFSVEQEIGPGLILWHPNLSSVRETLEDYWRIEHRKRLYKIVYTPHIANSKLWEISGHSANYAENMFYFNVDEEEYVIKPMNCPFHIMIYKSKPQSYRNLPLRMAELGTVYRNERSGTFHGMTRVRGFTQDDAHIFCTTEQFIDEIKDVISFVDETLQLFEISFDVEISTRPEEKYVGAVEIWGNAEAGLKQALGEYGLNYTINEGDGAFYGPKIDFKLKDALGRSWQGATVQLDFNLPQRFELEYKDKDGQSKTPIMIHRVIFGALERFVAVLIENYAGAFPAWIAPVAVKILPIADRHSAYANDIFTALTQLGVRAEVDDRHETTGAKIRDARLSRVPYMIILGDKELSLETVSLWVRGTGDVGAVNKEEFITRLVQEINTRGKDKLY